VKDYQVKNFDKFLDIANTYETPLKFFELLGDVIKAEANLRVMLVSFKGVKTDNFVSALEANGFTEVVISDTKPMME